MVCQFLESCVGWNNTDNVSRRGVQCRDTIIILYLALFFLFKRQYLKRLIIKRV